jgi:hypothetical protein
MSVKGHLTVADRRALVEHIGRRTIKAPNQTASFMPPLPCGWVPEAHLAANAIEFVAT